MEQRHRKIIQKSRSLFVANLVDVDGVCDKLYEHSILTSGMKEEILAERTRERMIRMLLDIIPKRGRNAYSTFHHVLVATGNKELADMLRPELALSFDSPRRLTRSLSETSKSEKVEAPDFSKSMTLPRKKKSCNDINLPTVWPSDPEHADPLHFADISTHPYSMGYVNETEAYPMKSAPKGTVLVINNFTFTSKKRFPDRTERAQIDASTIESVFVQMGFTPNIHNNVTYRKMSDILYKESQRDHSAESCFIMFIMSYGDEGAIYDVEDYGVPLDNMLSMFDAEHCPSLIGKPKLFFVQACRPVLSADQYDDMGSLKPDTMGEEALLSLVSDRTVGQEKPMEFPLQEGHTLQRSDMFIGRAVMDVSASYEKKQFGTKFIQALLFVIRKRACIDDLLTIVTKVNGLVSPESATEKETLVEFQSSLRKKFYLLSES